MRMPTKISTVSTSNPVLTHKSRKSSSLGRSSTGHGRKTSAIHVSVDVSNPRYDCLPLAMQTYASVNISFSTSISGSAHLNELCVVWRAQSRDVCHSHNENRSVKSASPLDSLAMIGSTQFVNHHPEM
eukprot:4332163-Amphidinium_carterae.1